MIASINKLQSLTKNANVKLIAEKAISDLTSALYSNVTPLAKYEIEYHVYTNLLKSLENYKNEKAVNEWLETEKRLFTVNNLGIRPAVNTLLVTEGKINPLLFNDIEKYSNALNDGISETRLYESFLNTLEPYKYIPSVEKYYSAISENLNEYKSDINIIKTIEEMKDTKSSYLVPLIEDVIHSYLKNRGEQQRAHTKEFLIKFSYDPFVRSIINNIAEDDPKMQLEYTNSLCNIEDNLCSPLLYLGENEMMFNVKGEYYVRKGNNINRVKHKDIKNIDNKFIALCETLNRNNIVIDSKSISVYGKSDKAVINENEVIINGVSVDQYDLSESYKMTMITGDRGFYENVLTISQNFNEIAKLDFIKRISLKENENFYADVFKVRNNIFITTNNPITNDITFYRNVNPIQAEKIIKEHLQFDISSMFKNVLPNKDKIISEINETKREYVNYINELQEKVNEFSQYNTPLNEKIIELLKEELGSAKKDYKEYSLKVDKFLDISENLNITVQDDTSGKSYTVVVPTGAMAAKKTSSNGEDIFNNTQSTDGNEFGTEVGASQIDIAPSSAVTFDSDESELLSDQPSDSDSTVDLGADETEAYADKVDAESELEPKEEPEESSDSEIEGDLDMGVEDKDTKSEESGLDNLSVEDDAEENSEPNEKEVDTKEGVGAPSKEAEENAFNKNKNPNDLDKPKKPKKVFLKRKKS